jgi:hypothetical protein
MFKSYQGFAQLDVKTLHERHLLVNNLLMESIAIRFSCGEFSLFFQKIIGEKIGKHVFEKFKMFFP